MPYKAETYDFLTDRESGRFIGLMIRELRILAELRGFMALAPGLLSVELKAADMVARSRPLHRRARNSQVEGPAKPQAEGKQRRSR